MSAARPEHGLLARTERLLERARAGEDLAGLRTELAGLLRVAEEPHGWAPLEGIEEAFGASTELNQRILEAVPGGVVVVAPDGAILRANAEAVRFLGLGYDELTRRFVSDFGAETWHEDGSPCPVQDYPVARCLATREPQPPVTIGVQQRDGSVRWAVFTAVPVVQPGSGRFLGVVVTFLDVTERKRDEEARRRSEERFRLVVENAPDYVFTVDPQGRILWINRVSPTQRMQDVVGRLSHDMASPEYREVWDATLRRAFAGQPCPPLETVSWQGGHFFTRCVPLRDEGGRISEVMFISTDVTEAKRAEQERQRLEARVQESQRLESLGLLAGGMAHDFNNLLVGILGGIELAQRRLSGATEEVGEILGTARQASVRAAELTHQLLAYAGKGRLSLEPTDLNAVVREVASLLGRTLGEKASLELTLLEPLPAIQGDQSQLARVVMNLVTNACEASHPRDPLRGPAPIHLRTRVVSRAEAQALATLTMELPLAEAYVLLEVQDEGTGMDERTRARILDPFFTTKFQGRGLGLPAVLGIVRGHQGGMGLHSAPGAGSTFRILVPSLGCPAPRRDAAPAVALPRPGPGTGPCVLVVDDEPHVRTVARMALEEHGFKVLVAAGGGQAVSLLETHGDEVQLVLLDLLMPDVDGGEALRAMRRLRPDLRVILSSGYEEETARRGFDREALAGFLHKPYAVTALVEAVTRATVAM